MTEGTENTETNEPVEEPVDVMVPNPGSPTVSVDPEPEPSVQESALGEAAGVAPMPEPITSDADVPEPLQIVLEAESAETAAVPETEPEIEPEPSAPTDETAEEVDDVAAAIAAAGANVADDASFDSIAPGTVAQDSEADGQVGAGIAVPGATTVSWVPFLIYDVVWLIFAGLLIWQFRELPVTEAIYNSDLYSLAVLGGVVLAAAGPLLIVAVWIGSWGNEGARRGQLLISSLTRGSIATLAGVVMWWGALLLLDQLRLGRLL